MSHDSNTQLIEEAVELCEYWVGTMHERLMRRAIESKDLEALKYHVDNANKEMWIQEDEGNIHDDVA